MKIKINKFKIINNYRLDLKETFSDLTFLELLEFFTILYVLL